MENQASKLIYKQISKVMIEAKAVGKDQKNTSQNFKYRGIDAIYNALQQIFAKHGVFSTPIVQSEHYEQVPSKNGGVLNYCTLKIQYVFYAEDGSSVEAVVIGQAMDTGDKAANKAMSIAHKYAITQILSLAYESEPADDPDAESHEPTTKKPQGAPASKPSAPSHVVPNTTTQTSSPAPANTSRPASAKASTNSGEPETGENFKIPSGTQAGKKLRVFKTEELTAMLKQIQEFIRFTPDAGQDCHELQRNLLLTIEKRMGKG